MRGTIGIMSAANADAVVVLRDASWADYKRILKLRGEKAVPRVTFSEGVLELTSPSQRREQLKTILGSLVEVFLEERGLDHLSRNGNWTLKEKAIEKGLEPDECFTREKAKRPDLAIEVIRSSGSTKKLEIYLALGGVREVWFWKRGTIQVFVLRRGAYVEASASKVLPGLDLQQLLVFSEVRPYMKAIRAYRAALKTK